MEGEIPVTRKRSNLESSKAAACRRRKKRLAVEAEALAKSTRHDDDPDRISELPDTILHHILSFLDMKHVIHTAFLSKRWTPIFKSLPTLSLDQSLYETMRLGNEIYQDIHNVEFLDFVDKVLCFRDDAANADNNSIIHSLRISCFDKNMEMNHVNTWIDFAVRHNVQELDFELAFKQHVYDDLFGLPNHSPLNLFKCKLLTTLTLGTNDPEVMMPHDLVVDLPKLKTLDLESFCFHGEKINENFFSRCLLLEKLIIDHCVVQSDTLNIVVSEDHQLKYLEIDTLRGWLNLDIIIFAPKLTSLSIRDDEKIFSEYNLANVNSLVKAQMDSYEVHSRNLMKFLKGVSNVKSLTLSSALFQGHNRSVEIHACLKDLLSPFHNLRVLKLLVNTSFERDQIRAIAYLLEKCSSVETIALKLSPLEFIRKAQPNEQGNIMNKECGRAELSPLQFKLDHLKFIEIRGFTGCWNELEFLTLMLMHTPVLEKMIIFAHKSHLATRNKETYGAVLETSPRVSSQTKFLFL